MPSKTIIQLRRDTAANWTATNPILAAGETGVETDTGKFKIGDGTTAWTSLAFHTHAISDVAGLQDALDDKAVQGSNGLPYRMAAGTISVSGGGTATGNATVTFPSGRFSVAPRVVASGSTNTNLMATSQGTTSTGTTIYMRHVDNTNWTTAQSAEWMAIQMTSGAASG